MKARLRPMIWPILPPVIMKAAITSVYIVIASWMPVTVVPTSLATVAIETFITDVSSVIRNCADASVRRTTEAAPAASAAFTGALSVDIGGSVDGDGGGNARSTLGRTGRNPSQLLPQHA